MSNPILQSIETSLPTDGTPGTDLTASATSSTSVSLTSNSISTSVESTSSGTTSLPPPISTPSSTSISTSSSPTSIHVTSTTSSTSILTSSTSLISTSTSVSPTETSSSTTTTATTVTNSDTSTSTSVAPTTFINSQSNSNDLVSHRTAVIAGTTIGLVAFVLVILAAIFIHRRHKLRKVMEVSGKKREGRGLLDGEEFDDDERNNSNMQSYRDHRYPTHLSHPAASSAVSLLKTRTSETGSIFREEVWPPPGFIDPISKQSNQVDLSSIVDDVMGPSTSYKPSHNSSVTSFTSSRGSSTEPDERRQPTDASAVSTLSSTSTAPLITNKSYSDPFQPNSGPSIRPPPSFPVGASVPATPGALSKISYPTVPSIPSLPPLARSQPRFPNTQPQKSSPLARSLTSDTNLWLTRNVHPNRTKPQAPP